MARIFGTDGIRGLANVAPMSPEVVMGLGRAAVDILSSTASGVKPSLDVGRDTRLSSPMLEAAVTAGICSAGADVLAVGVLPTPGVAYLTRHTGAVGGVVISASLLLYEHSLVRPGDLSKLDAAFFTMNGVISLTLLGFVRDMLRRAALQRGTDALAAVTRPKKRRAHCQRRWLRAVYPR